MDISWEEKFNAWEMFVQKGTVPPKCDPWTDNDEKALIEAS